MKSKILFLKFGSFSNVNDSLQRIFGIEFPQYEIDVIDVWDLLKNKTPYSIYLINSFYFIYEYGIKFLTGKKEWNQFNGWFFATSYISLYIARRLQILTKGKNYKFSFQTQSLYNGKIEGIPNFIYTDHSTKTNLLYPDIKPAQYIRSKAWIKKAEINTFRDASLIFTFGNLVRHSLIHQYNIPEEKVITVFTGSNVSYDPAEVIKKQFRKNILFVGGDWERKGGPILIKVFKKVKHQHPDATLTIVSNTPAGLSEPGVNILGRLPVQELSKYYNEADIFCLPTLREPFGVVFVEAMKHHLPIVSNNIGGLPDLVKDDFNGYLIDNKIEDYVAAICHLLNNPDKCREMGENGYNFAKENFTWEKVGSTIKKNIERILSSN